MKEIIIASICIVAFVICLGVLVWGVWTAISMICEARDGKKKKSSVNYSAEVNSVIEMRYKEQLQYP